MIGDWGKGWEIQVQPVTVQSKPKRMQEGDVGTKSIYILPIRPLSKIALWPAESKHLRNVDFNLRANDTEILYCSRISYTICSVLAAITAKSWSTLGATG